MFHDITLHRQSLWHQITIEQSHAYTVKRRGTSASPHRHVIHQISQCGVTSTKN